MFPTEAWTIVMWKAGKHKKCLHSQRYSGNSANIGHCFGVTSFVDKKVPHLCIRNSYRNIEVIHIDATAYNLTQTPINRLNNTFIFNLTRQKSPNSNLQLRRSRAIERFQLSLFHHYCDNTKFDHLKAYCDT